MSETYPNVYPRPAELARQRERPDVFGTIRLSSGLT